MVCTADGNCCGSRGRTRPTAEWLARQITEAFPWASAPADLVRLPDCGHKLRNTGRDFAANCETKFRCDEVGPKQARGKLVSKSVAFPLPPTTTATD